MTLTGNINAYYEAKGCKVVAEQSIRASLGRGHEFVICNPNGVCLPKGRQGFYRLATMAEFEENKGQ